MNPDLDNAVEALLREQFEGPVPDGGFSGRVIHHLRQRRHRVTWPLWLGVVAGATACWLSLLTSRLPRAGWRDWMTGDWSTPAIVLLLAALGMAMLALAWGVAEAEDR